MDVHGGTEALGLCDESVVWTASHTSGKGSHHLQRPHRPAALDTTYLMSQTVTTHMLVCTSPTDNKQTTQPSPEPGANGAGDGCVAVYTQAREHALVRQLVWQSAGKAVV